MVIPLKSFSFKRWKCRPINVFGGELVILRIQYPGGNCQQWFSSLYLRSAFENLFHFNIETTNPMEEETDMADSQEFATEVLTCFLHNYISIKSDFYWSKTEQLVTGEQACTCVTRNLFAKFMKTRAQICSSVTLFCSIEELA